MLFQIQAWFKSGEIDWQNGLNSQRKTEAGSMYE